LLFMHGSPIWSFIFRHTIGALRSQFRCIAVDMPGLGLFTALVACRREFECNSTYYRKFVQHLDLTNVTLPTLPPKAAAFAGALAKTGDMMRLLEQRNSGRLYAPGGILAPIALLLFAPVIVNIAFFHALLARAAAGQGRW
jgi:hypothetical protein